MDDETIGVVLLVLLLDSPVELAVFPRVRGLFTIALRRPPLMALFKLPPLFGLAPVLVQMGNRLLDEPRARDPFGFNDRAELRLLIAEGEIKCIVLRK